MYRMLLVVVGTITLFVCFLLLPDSPMLRAMGITGLQKRVSATTNGMYWSTRATFHREGESGYTQIYGNVEGIDQSGKLIVTVAQGDKWVRYQLTLANVEIPIFTVSPRSSARCAWKTHDSTFMDRNRL